MRKVFLYKENTDDRDCCAYIEAKPMRWECGHYFGDVTLHGACYCNHDLAPYEDIKTVLTEEEYNQLVKFSHDIDELGYGIKEGDDRYKRGVKLCEAIQPIYDKLLSEENEALFKEVQQEEANYLMDEYALSMDDIEEIFNDYPFDYRDRAVVGCIYSDTYEYGYSEAEAYGLLTGSFGSIVEKYFDFKSFGEDIAGDDASILLDDGRVVAINL